VVRLTQARPDEAGIVFASQGYGPLLERSYVAVIEGAKLTPESILDRVRSEFVCFAPAETARFCCRSRGEGQALQIGDVLEIELALVGNCAVKVVHVDDLRLTMRTLAGHPEAGLISFSAGRDEQERPTFEIRSRTRANGLLNFAGFLIVGKQMQARCWINFIGNLVESLGGQIIGAVKVRTRVVREQPSDCPGGPAEPQDEGAW
jgi:hypothetical protein